MAGRLTQHQIRGARCAATLAIVAFLLTPQHADGQSNRSGHSSPELIQEWIAELGSDSFAVREAATRRLTAAGADAMRAVAAVVTNSDPEVAWRARAILTSIAKSDGTSVPILAELKQAGPEPVGRIVGSILELPTVNEQYKSFKRDLKEELAAELARARDDLVLGQFEAARRRVRHIQVQDERHGLFDAPNPILVVLVCLEVEAAGKDFRAGDVENRKEKAEALMQQARLDVLAGRLEPARRFASVAGLLGVTPDRQTDPRLLLAEIESTSLLREAREDVAAGRLAVARKKVLAIEETDRQFGLFAHAVVEETRAWLGLFRMHDLDGDLRVLSAEPEELVETLLKLARADLRARRLNAARDKAALAQAFGVDERAKFFLKDIDDLLKNSDHRQLVAGRLLEISQEFAAEGDTGQAKNWLAHIVRVYPTTETSVKARQVLQSLP